MSANEDALRAYLEQHPMPMAQWSSERLLAGRAPRPVVDAFHCTLMRTNQGKQRQAKMGDPSCRDHKLPGDVR